METQDPVTGGESRTPRSHPRLLFWLWAGSSLVSSLSYFFGMYLPELIYLFYFSSTMMHSVGIWLGMRFRHGRSSWLLPILAFFVLTPLHRAGLLFIDSSYAPLVLTHAILEYFQFSISALCMYLLARWFGVFLFAVGEHEEVATGGAARVLDTRILFGATAAIAVSTSMLQLIPEGGMDFYESTIGVRQYLAWYAVFAVVGSLTAMLAIPIWIRFCLASLLSLSASFVILAGAVYCFELWQVSHGSSPRWLDELLIIMLANAAGTLLALGAFTACGYKFMRILRKHQYAVFDAAEKPDPFA